MLVPECIQYKKGRQTKGGMCAQSPLKARALQRRHINGTSQHYLIRTLPRPLVIARGWSRCGCRVGRNQTFVGAERRAAFLGKVACWCRLLVASRGCRLRDPSRGSRGRSRHTPGGQRSCLGTPERADASKFRAGVMKGTEERKEEGTRRRGWGEKGGRACTVLCGSTCVRVCVLVVT